VQAAAAESSDAPAPPRQQQQRQRRAPRVVTVQIASIQPGQEFDGTVVRIFEAAAAARRGGVRTSRLLACAALS